MHLMQLVTISEYVNFTHIIITMDVQISNFSILNKKWTTSIYINL